MKASAPVHAAAKTSADAGALRQSPSVKTGWASGGEAYGGTTPARVGHHYSLLTHLRQYVLDTPLQLAKLIRSPEA